MMRYSILLGLAATLATGAAHAQNTGPMPAGGSTPTAPSAVRTPATGITGVPRYRVGLKGARGTVAPAATGSINTVGDADGNGRPDSRAALPGAPRIAFNSLGMRPGTPIQVRLSAAIDSGHAKNGDVVHGTLVSPAGSAPAGAPVELTVVAAASAGQMTSAGELSLQVVKLNGQDALSQVITVVGKEGKAITADAAPERGTEAIVTPDKALTLPAG